MARITCHVQPVMCTVRVGGLMGASRRVGESANLIYLVYTYIYPTHILLLFFLNELFTKLFSNIYFTCDLKTFLGYCFLFYLLGFCGRVNSWRRDDGII